MGEAWLSCYYRASLWTWLFIERQGTFTQTFFFLPFFFFFFFFFFSGRGLKIHETSDNETATRSRIDVYISYRFCFALLASIDHFFWLINKRFQNDLFISLSLSLTLSLSIYIYTKTDGCWWEGNFGKPALGTATNHLALLVTSYGYLEGGMCEVQTNAAAIILSRYLLKVLRWWSRLEIHLVVKWSMKRRWSSDKGAIVIYIYIYIYHLPCDFWR